MADPADTPIVSETQISNLAEAVALYRGEFMAGFYLDGCPEFETWLVREQEAWRQQVTGILDCLTVYHGLRRQYNEAQSYVKRWLAFGTVAGGSAPLYDDSAGPHGQARRRAGSVRNLPPHPGRSVGAD